MKCLANYQNGTEILLDYCSGTLAPDQAQAVDAHARQCEECRNLIAAQRSVFESLDSFEAPEVSANFDTRLYARIAQQEAKRQPFWQRWFSDSAGFTAWWKPALAGALAAVALAAVLVFPSVRETPTGNEFRIDQRVDKGRVDIDQVEQALEDLDLLAPQSASGPM